MSWISDVFAGNDAESGGGDRPPGDRVLQIRRGISAAAEALEDTHPELARDAVAAADVVGDRVARLASAARAPADGGAAPDAEGEAATAGDRRRPAGGAPTETAGTDPLPRGVVSEAVEELEQLHFHLLEVEVRGADPDALPFADVFRRLETLAERLPGSDAVAGG